MLVLSGTATLLSRGVNGRHGPARGRARPLPGPAPAKVAADGVPAVEASSRNSVVILRLRGRTDLGGTFTNVVRRYAESLRAVGSKLVIVSANNRVVEQLAATRVLDVVHPDDVYAGDEWVGRTVRRAHDDALDWIEANRQP